MKKVLITGANSYIGVSFENYVKKHYSSDISISTLDMLDPNWNQMDFRLFDVIFHVAGIAHADIGNVDESTKKKYYDVNTNLAIKTAKKAKKEGVRQFILMSSAIIYGDSAPRGTLFRINADTIPHPSNFYGDSKWQADKGTRALEDQNFKVAVIRAPMIYGKGSKGNYQLLSKIAKKSIIFPNIQNERSMLYIENLCEFLSQLVIRNLGGIFWPQNPEYTVTCDLVKTIALVNGHKIYLSSFLNIGISFLSFFSNKIKLLTNKAFGNMTYDRDISKYDFNYQIFDLRTSIERIEKK